MGCIVIYVCAALFYTSVGCIDVDKWAAFVIYMWAALFYTSVGCIDVENWAALLFICGLHCCIQLQDALL